MTQLDKYELHEQLGKGGFGTVYRATDTSLGREVAIKVLHPQLMVDETFVERFKKEARILAAFDHPNIVTIHDMVEVDGRVFIVMRYLSGGSLQYKLLNSGVFSFEQTVLVLSQVCKGLQVAHKQGLVHRDIKPANILFDAEENVILSDFGLARAVELSGITSSIGIAGTPAYRAPELWRANPVTPATDIYSLGCILSEMLTGKLLFDGKTPDAILTQHLIDGPQFPMSFLDGVPEKVFEVLKQALEKDQSMRQANAEAFLKGLLDCKQIDEKISNDQLSVIEYYQDTKGSKQQGVKPESTIEKNDNDKVNIEKLVNEIRIEIARGVSMDFVCIPAGEFLMGSDPKVDPDYQKDELPQKIVNISDYWICKFPVTNEQFKQFLYQTNNYEGKREWSEFDSDELKTHPVTNVSWNEAVQFCDWISRKVKEKIQLPTEAQWEKAARGVDGSIYPWHSGLGDYLFANYGKKIKGTTPIDAYPDGISPFGILDMAGNVYEWVSDWYDDEYYKKMISNNPTGPDEGVEKVVRGGSFIDDAIALRAAYRERVSPTERSYDIGFRCVLS